MTSAGTSIPGNIPAIVKKKYKDLGPLNFDIGSGIPDADGKTKTTKFLAKHGVKNITFDPYHNTQEHNSKSIQYIESHGLANTVVVANVLNVIPDYDERLEIIEMVHDFVRSGGVVYFQIFEGHASEFDKKGYYDTDKRRTSESRPGDYQLNRKTKSFIPEIKKFFNNVKVSGNFITAWNEINNPRTEIYHPKPQKQDKYTIPWLKGDASLWVDEDLDYADIKHTDIIITLHDSNTQKILFGSYRAGWDDEAVNRKDCKFDGDTNNLFYQQLVTPPIGNTYKQISIDDAKTNKNFQLVKEMIEQFNINEYMLRFLPSNPRTEIYHPKPSLKDLEIMKAIKYGRHYGYVDNEENYINLSDEIIKPGDYIKLHFAGGPKDMPFPWKMKKAENYFSSVYYKVCVRLHIEASNGNTMIVDYAHLYSPHPDN